MPKKTQDFYEVTDKVIRKAERLAARGLTLVQIGLSLGWCEDTIHRKKKGHPELSEAIKRGQAKGIETATNSLMKKVKGFTSKEIHEEVKEVDGKITRHKKIVTKKIAPSDAATIFYLKNRDPENWKDVQDHKIMGDIILNTDSDDDQL